MSISHNYMRSNGFSPINFLLFIGFFILSLGYEYNFRRLGIHVLPAGIGLLFLLSATVLKLNSRNEFGKVKFIVSRGHFVLILLVGISFLYAFVGQVVAATSGGASADIIKPLLQVCVFAVCLMLYSNHGADKFYIIFCMLSAILALISIYIALTGSFLIWTKQNLRYASIFLDPNFAGVMLGLAAILSLKLRIKYLSNLIFFVCVVGVFLSYSKGAFLTMFASLILILSLKNWRIFLLVSTFLTVVLYYSDLLLRELSQRFTMFRFETGLNNRYIYIEQGVREIAKDPFASRTINDVLEITSVYGNNNSLHNTFVETAFIYGLPVSLIHLVISLIAGFELYKQGRVIECSAVVYLLIGTLNFTFMYCSVGIISVMWVLITLQAFDVPVQRFSKGRIQF